MVELEVAALARASEITQSPPPFDADYIEGFRAATAAAIDYGIASIETGNQPTPPVPAAILMQARLAARLAIGLDTVLRRYFAGFALFSDFVMQELKAMDLPQQESERLMKLSRNPFDRLIAEVSEEFARERQRRIQPPDRRRADRVRRLVEGETEDGGDLAYDLDCWHIGLVVSGKGAPEAIRALGASTDRRALAVRTADGVVWGWLGGRRRIPTEVVIDEAEARWPPHLRGAVGEPARDLEGWRLSHREAMKALPFSLRERHLRLVRYRDVALLSAVLADDVLTRSLRCLYLAPLADERNGGTDLLDTLRAYLVAERNVSSAAAHLDVKRHTVTNRLRAIETKIGRPIRECIPELSIALQLHERADLDERRSSLWPYWPLGRTLTKR